MPDTEELCVVFVAKATSQNGVESQGSRMTENYMEEVRQELCALAQNKVRWRDFTDNLSRRIHPRTEGLIILTSRLQLVYGGLANIRSSYK